MSIEDMVKVFDSCTEALVDLKEQAVGKADFDRAKLLRDVQEAAEQASKVLKKLVK